MKIPMAMSRQLQDAFKSANRAHVLALKPNAQKASRVIRNWFRTNRLGSRSTTVTAWDDPAKTVTFTDLSDIHTAHSN